MISPQISRWSDNSETILCCYSNRTSHIQVTRIDNIEGWYFERVIFPGQQLLFEAPSQAQLEIYTGTMGSAILLDRVQCHSLQLDTLETRS